MKHILFVCTGNSCRSVMAEAFFRKLTADRPGEFSVSSAGVSAIDGFPATPETVQVLKREGMDVSAHRSRRLTPAMVQAADKIYVMEKIHGDCITEGHPEAAAKVSLLTEYSSRNAEVSPGGGVPDPIRMSEDFYKNVLGVIRDCVSNIVKTLRGNARLSEHKEGSK